MSCSVGFTFLQLYEYDLKILRQLEESCSVASLHKDIHSLQLVLRNGFFHLRYVVELAECSWCRAVFKLLSYEPNLLQSHGGELVNDALMLVVRDASKLFHVTDDAHLMRCLDGLEVGEGGSHTCRVGVICIHDKTVALRLLKL